MSLNPAKLKNLKDKHTSFVSEKTSGDVIEKVAKSVVKKTRVRKEK